ncbi:MAG: DUF4233 domain-containing protein, partial [Actinobacteria bacterium]|nr:DUF4233 domain-containing protein [Actinomycetota bacterium]
MATEAQHYAQELRRIEGEIFGRRGEGHVHPTNERMQALVELLGDPQRSFRAIHLTGTNGKTSTARMVDELLRGFGLRVGRYTSPHLASVTERIVVDGEPITDRTFVEGYNEIKPYIDLVDQRFPVPLSFFEIVTALAYSVFADTPVDVAVVEVGMGGAWDNTNVIDAEIAVVTPIGLDHTQYLGETIAQIAVEKAGIIKPEAVAILAAQPPEAPAEPTPEQYAERARRANKATRGALAGVLGLEALVVLLIPRAIAFTTGLGPVRTGICIGLAVVLVLAAGLVRRPWGIGLGSVLQVAFLATGVMIATMFLIGALFIA